MSSSGGGARAWALGGMAALSLALHAGGLALASRLEPRKLARPRPAEVAFEVEPAPPPAPPPPPRVEPPPPAPEPRPAPRRVAMARLPPPPTTAPPPQEPPPPPPPHEAPHEAPPSDAPPAKAAPRVGISLSSTATAGAFAVGVGNTLHGKASEVAGDPRQVRPYPAEGTAPPAPAPPPAARPSAQPRLLEQPEVPYPAEARRAGVEGKVKLLLHVDRQGRVISARVLADPGAGLGEAARAGALRFRFSPGLLDGEPVEVPDFPYTYTFVLE